MVGLDKPAIPGQLLFQVWHTCLWHMRSICMYLYNVYSDTTVCEGQGGHPGIVVCPSNYGNMRYSEGIFLECLSESGTQTHAVSDKFSTFHGSTGHEKDFQYTRTCTAGFEWRLLALLYYLGEAGVCW